MAAFQVRSLCHAISASENPQKLEGKTAKATTKVTHKESPKILCYNVLAY